MITNEWKLREACDICIADMGKEDPQLSARLFLYIKNHYGARPGTDWDYNLVDEVLEKMLNGTL